MQTLVTTGFGDLSPITYNEMIFAILFMFLGCIGYSLIISSLSTLMGSLDDKKLKFDQKMIILNGFKKNYNLSEDVYKRIIKSLKYDIEK